MKKLVLRDGTEFHINSDANISDNRIQISFAKITSYDDLRSKLTASITKTIKVYDSDTSIKAYENYTKIIDPCTITTASDGTSDVVVFLEKLDEKEALLMKTLERQDYIESALNDIILGGM